MKQENGAAYFDDYVPEYFELYRLNHVVTIIDRYRQKDSSLLDIGCGTGNALQFIKNRTGLQDVSGMDVSSKSLSRARERLNCQTFQGSILDNHFVENVGRRFDFALLAAVLHHLVGKTRRQSKNHAQAAISNSLKLLKDHGHLIILEPVFYTSLAMDMVFHIKKFATKLTSRRIPIIGDRHSSIGAPLVSYYTNEQLIEMIHRVGHCRIAETKIEDKKVKMLWRFALITRRTDTTIVVRKTNE
jgi:SAM-dependent methyltransferase